MSQMNYLLFIFTKKLLETFYKSLIECFIKENDALVAIVFAGSPTIYSNFPKSEQHLSRIAELVRL